MKKEQETAAVQIPQEAEGEVIVAEEESKGKRILNTIVNVVLVVAIALAAVCTYASYVSTSGNGVPNIFGVRIFSIQTESMYPTLLPGDLIFDTGVKEPEELRKDDIITYWTVINGELIFSTKGDNNTSADPLTVHESEIVGKYSFRVPGVGKVFDYLQTSTGFLIVIVIPVFLFFLFHLVQFFRVLFEYQNVKNRIKFEQERGRTEDLIDQEQKRQSEAQAAARLKMEEELRERLRAEIMASMAAQQAAAPAAEEVPAEEAPAEEEKPSEEPAEETPAEEASEEETVSEEAEEKVEEAADEAADKTEENA